MEAGRAIPLVHIDGSEQRIGTARLHLRRSAGARQGLIDIVGALLMRSLITKVSGFRNCVLRNLALQAKAPLVSHGVFKILLGTVQRVRRRGIGAAPREWIGKQNGCSQARSVSVSGLVG